MRVLRCACRAGGRDHVLKCHILSRIARMQRAVAKPHRCLQENLRGRVAIDQATEMVDEKDAPALLVDHVLPVLEPLAAEHEGRTGGGGERREGLLGASDQGLVRRRRIGCALDRGDPGLISDRDVQTDVVADLPWGEQFGIEWLTPHRCRVGYVEIGRVAAPLDDRNCSPAVVAKVPLLAKRDGDQLRERRRGDEPRPLHREVFRNEHRADPAQEVGEPVADRAPQIAVERGALQQFAKVLKLSIRRHQNQPPG